MAGDCSQDLDPRKLVRDGTHQVQRARSAPDPASVPVDERRPEHAMVFAGAFAGHLPFARLDGGPTDETWQPFFTADVSAQLAVAAVEDVAAYRIAVKERLRSLEDPELPASAPTMVAALGEVFDSLGTLAARLDDLKQGLPADQALRATMSNLIRSQLAPMLRRLIGYHAAGVALGVVDPAAAPPTAGRILGQPVERFADVIARGLSGDWPAGVDLDSWSAYAAVDAEAAKGAYGPGATPVDLVNHLATHHLFTAICDAFLGVFARIADDAGSALESTFEWDGHEPHYALFLAFLQLLEHARREANAIPAKHLDHYYREALGLEERPAQPAHAHVLVDLAKRSPSHLVAKGTLLKAGKDAEGRDAHFAVDRDLVANRAHVVELRSSYRHHSPQHELPLDEARPFASPVAASDDGLGAALTSADGSWHPFANTVHTDGKLKAIRMPPAEVGFAVASPQLWLAEGERRIWLTLGTTDTLPAVEPDDLWCRLTTAKGWLDVPVGSVTATKSGLLIGVVLDGNAPPITPYHADLHGRGLDAVAPVLLLTVRHRPGRPWAGAALGDIDVGMVRLLVQVEGLRTLALSNDHGTIDGSKPFAAYGPAPITGSSLVIGSKEVFQKQPHLVRIHVDPMVTAVGHQTTPGVEIDRLDEGRWVEWTGSTVESSVNAREYELTERPRRAVTETDLTPDEALSTTSRNGFVRLRLTGGFGTDAYPVALASWVVGGSHEANRPKQPVVPMWASLSVDYDAEHLIPLDRGDGPDRFFHITPFGHARPHPSGGTVPLLHPFLVPKPPVADEPAEAELCIGVSDLVPPQQLALLIQVVDGTANPLVEKPEDHVRWSYLRGDEWVALPKEEVSDGTDGLLASGIVTLSVPDDASTQHTLLPAGQHWVRASVASASDAVGRLLQVSAQALRATAVVTDGDPAAAGDLPAGTISKLAEPDAAVKGLVQPFTAFGGRPRETSGDFASRVSERLRHKDRAIALWDVEHLVLEAFPGIFQVRCLNHTRYEPSSTGAGIYRELAPGHITVVTIPDLVVPDHRDPLRPFTSLRVLGEVERFLAARTSCFAKLHVRNPQFEEVLVSLRVRFVDGVDEAFHRARLQREITQLLSPWAFRSDAHPTFQGKVHKSVVVDFIDERPYVDYVTDVHLFRKDPTTQSLGPDLDAVEGSRAVSILVSAPAHEHVITTIRPDELLDAERCACGPGVT